MNREQKAAVVEEIAAQIDGSEAVFAVDYRGITVPQAAELRAKLREADATFRVVKNSLTERAADRAGTPSLRELLEGPTALTFVRGDAALAAKAISDFARGTDTLAFKGGLLGGEALEVEQIRAIARLPSRDVLQAQLVGTIAAPLTGLVRGLNALIAGLAIQLQQIADQGLVTGEAPAAPAAAEEPTAEAAPADEPAAEAETPADEATAEAETPAEAEAPTAEPETAEAEAEGPTTEAEASPEEPPSPDGDAQPEEEPASVQPDQAEGADNQSEISQDDEQ